MSVIIIKKESSVYAIEGELNMQTVPDASKQLAQLMSEATTHSEKLTLDLAGVSRSDSAGVAMLIDVMQIARKAKQTLLFTNLPPQMKDIAGISGLLDILPIANN